MSQKSLMLTHAFIEDATGKYRNLRDGALFIEKNRIVGIGNTDEIKSRYNPDLEKDCSGKLVLPGLIDSHVHLAQALLRGCADELSLLDWLTRRIWPLQGSYSREEARLSAELCCLEMLKSGTTTLVECQLQTSYGLDGIAETIKKSGLRAILSKSVMDQESYANEANAIPESVRESARDSMNGALSMVSRWNGKASDRIHIWFGPRTPGGCSADFYREIAEQAAKHGIGVTIHLAEVEEDVKYIRKNFGMSPMQFMEHCGLVGRHMIYAHGVWFKPVDLEILRKTQGTVCHCPASNLKLASGFAPVNELIRSGVNVALGCDGAPCNNSYDMIREMRLASLVQKCRLRNALVIPAREALKLATQNGATPTSWGDKLGVIGPGRLADLIVVDLKKPHLSPVFDPVSNLVYAATGSDVDTVIVDGKILMEGRKVKTMDEERIISAAQEFAPELKNRIKRIEF
jgi:cytosine/adenosine deaminase-related metal-dependent hydrolase